MKGDNGAAVLLIHGITGTPSEMRYVGRGLHKAGFTVMCNALPRHCATLAELKKVTWEEIACACAQDFVRLAQGHAAVFVAGISMGALMAIHLAYQFPEKTKGVGALASTIDYDGWALHKGKDLMKLAWHLPFVRNRIYIRESAPYGLKDEGLRSDIERFYKNAKANGFDTKSLLFGSPFFPMANLYQHHQFSKVVIKEMPLVKTPVVLLHAKEDDMASVKNAEYILRHIGSSRKELIMLEDSYHMITIDRDKDKVIQVLVDFFKAQQ